MYEYDIVIIGAGLVGISTAYHLKKKYPHKSLLIIEKESTVCVHQSGNNSGVIHSGIYYKPGSLKAINCINGYNDLLEFARTYNIPHDVCGKIIVATSTEETHALNNIYIRGEQNGLTGIRKLNKEQLVEVEPHVNGVSGLFVPQTGIIDYLAVANKMLSILVDELGGETAFNEEVVNIEMQSNINLIVTNKKTYCASKVVSCAGLYSDRVTSMTEKKNTLRIIPFRGEYYKLKPEKEYLVKNLIYPVPNPKFPFLGVHFTRMVNGGVEAGPNAVFAFKREGYRFSDFNFRDISESLLWPGFWKVVAKYGRTGAEEIYRSLSKEAFTRALQKLIPEITENDLIKGGAGVRAQACDRNGTLIDDFDISQSKNIVHVRNAPSPAATSCLAIGKYISNRV